MLYGKGIPGTIVAMLALFVAAGCTEQVSPEPQAGAAAQPELAGAWYQIYFDTNSSTLGARGQTIVNTVAYVAANAGPTRVTVIGRGGVRQMRTCL